MAKLYPAWLGDLEIEFNVNDISNFIANVGAALTGMTISNLEFVTEVLELTPQSLSQVLEANQMASQNKIVIKSQSFTYGSTTLAASSSGVNDINFSTRVFLYQILVTE